MKPGYICVAGIDPDTGHHVRPVTAGRLSRSLLGQEGGVFDIGNVVELGEVNNVGRPPETEDFSFDPANARIVDKLSNEQFWDVISSSAHDSLSEVFGSELEPHGKGLAISKHKGTVSLGCLRLTVPTTLIIKEFEGKERLRILITDSGSEFDLSVTDIRFYERDQQNLKYAEVYKVAQYLREPKEVLFSVGLARAWLKPGDSEARHWLQLNNTLLHNYSF